MKFILDNGNLVLESELMIRNFAMNEIQINEVSEYTGDEVEFSEFRKYMNKIVKFTNLKVYANDIKENMVKNRTVGQRLFSFAPTLVLGVATATGYAGGGIFWGIFMEYIFPYLIDIAKVYCVIKIAQGFYEEKKGASGNGTAMSSLVSYGKWYLMFMLIPVGVELIDQIGLKMLEKLKTGGL